MPMTSRTSTGWMAWSLRSRRVWVAQRAAVRAKDVPVAAVIAIAGVADAADRVVALAVVREVTVVAILAAVVVGAADARIG
jgi:hypothetical protein